MNKFIDSFLFNDELDMLEFRLTEHDSFTDYFVLIECNKTHSLKPKELYATNNIDRFHKWKDKLIIVVIDVNLIKNLQWRRLEALTTQTSGIQKARWLEDFSRECGIQKVKELYNNNLIDSNTIVSCVGDVDEIYDKEKIEELK